MFKGQKYLTKGVKGLHIRNRNYGFGWIPYSWVLGPLGYKIWMR